MLQQFFPDILVFLIYVTRLLMFESKFCQYVKHIMFISSKKRTVYKDEKVVTVHVNCSSLIISGTSWYHNLYF